MSNQVAKQVLLLSKIGGSAVSAASGTPSVSIQHKQALLKNLLLKLNKARQYQSESDQFIPQLRSQHFNKGNSLQSHNDLSMFKHQIFNYNKNKEIDAVLLDRQVSQLIKKFLTVSSSPGTRLGKNGPQIYDKNTIYPIYISEPVFKHTTSRVEISFYYYNNFENNGNRRASNKYYNSEVKYYTPLINKLMNTLCGNTENGGLTAIFEQFYEKSVTIVPHKLKYVHNDTTILGKYIANQTEKNASFLKSIDRKLNFSLPNISDELSSIDYNIKLMDLAEKRINKSIKQYQNDLVKNIDLTKVYESDYDNLAKDMVMFKYLIGVQIQGKGRSALHAAIARAQSFNLLKGTFRNKVFDSNILSNRYKLNHLKSNIEVCNSPIVTKYGKYNIGLKTNVL